MRLDKEHEQPECQQKKKKMMMMKHKRKTHKNASPNRTNMRIAQLRKPLRSFLRFLLFRRFIITKTLAVMMRIHALTADIACGITIGKLFSYLLITMSSVTMVWFI